MVDGFLIIDKPAGCTSHDIVNRVRRILGTKKVGHTGTLDPFATGVLPIAVGEGTKAIPFLDEGIKEYQAVLRLGLATDTLDFTGTSLHEADYSMVTETGLRTAMEALIGDIEQIPPMYSAVKQGGQPLYKLARRGLEVERTARPVTIRRFELVAFDPPVARVLVCCSRGTYVRTLADDLGRNLGCGACLTELRRTVSGPFRLADALTVEQLEALVAAGQLSSHLLSPLAMLAHLTRIALEQDGARLVRNGQVPYGCRAPGLAEGECCCLTGDDGTLLAVARQQQGQLVLQRGFVTS
ncbi:MAG: tRNA pseudouridine(55) synthase TruB [Trichlorobacter sp.]